MDSVGGDTGQSLGGQSVCCHLSVGGRQSVFDSQLWVGGGGQ